MSIEPWKLMFAIGVACSCLAGFLGEAAQGIVLLTCCFTTGTAILVALAWHHTTERGPWIGYAATCYLLLLAAVLRGANVMAVVGFLRIPDYVSACAYVIVIYCTYRLRRLRSSSLDPTSLIDSLALTMAVGIIYWAGYTAPYLANHATIEPARNSLKVFCTFDLAIFYALARLAIGPGARNTSWYLLSFTTGGVFFSDIVLSSAESSTPFAGSTVLGYMLPSISIFILGAAALHPSMVDITKPSRVEVPRMTAARLAVMMAAALLPSIVVAARIDASWASRTGLAWLAAACGVVTTLMMGRFSGIAFARERAADLERQLANATASLATTTDTRTMHQTVASSTAGFVSDLGVNVFVTVAIRRGTEWQPLSDTTERHQLDAASINSEVLASFTQNGAQIEPLLLPSGKSIDRYGNIECFSTVVPLRSRNTVRGALIIGTDRPVKPSTLSALTSWAGHVALAIEAATLSEHLHKERSERRFRALVNNSADLIIVVNESQGITFASPAAERLLGGRRGDIRALLAAADDEDASAILNLFERAVRSGATSAVECRLVDPEGVVYWYELSATDMRADAEVEGIVLNAHNITERKALEENLRHQVLHDSLTGIANRVLLRERLQHSLNSRAQGSVAAVLFVDIDDFKTVNDSLGHHAGDELLKVLAFRLQAHLRSDDTAARLGGDEFAILLENLDDDNYAIEVAIRLQEALGAPVEFEGRSISVKASIGIAYGEQNADCDVVLRNADAAMYHAKWNGKDKVEVFDLGMYRDALDRLELKADLANAIERNELMLYYQPLVDMKSEKTAGFEALLRWNHPTRGFVSPLAFIPLAEETGLITEIGKWVLSESLRQLAEWNAITLDRRLKMSINLSPLQLKDDQILRKLSEFLAIGSVVPSQVTLELTETAALETEDSTALLLSMRGLGVDLAADDFGTGFASYAALQQLPFTVVKIDRSIIMGMPDSTGRAEAQVRSIIEMAHATELQVVAEGIEDVSQKEILQAMGCDRGQGFFFNRPLPVQDASELVRSMVNTSSSIS